MNLEFQIRKSVFQSDDKLVRQIRKMAKAKEVIYHIYRTSYTVFVTAPAGSEIAHELVKIADTIVLRDVEQALKDQLSLRSPGSVTTPAWATVYRKTEFGSTMSSLWNAVEARIGVVAKRQRALNETIRPRTARDPSFNAEALAE